MFYKYINIFKFKTFFIKHFFIIYFNLFINLPVKHHSLYKQKLYFLFSYLKNPKKVKEQKYQLNNLKENFGIIN